MRPTLALAALGATLALGACVSGQPQGPAAIIVPGQDKTAAAFQQDQAVCQQHATAHTGYGTPSEPAPGNSPANAAAQTAQAAQTASPQPTSDISFMQCMAARGDIVQMAPAGDPYAYGSPYPYAYPYPDYYPYAYPGYAFALGGVGLFYGGAFHHGFYHNGFHHGGFYGPGFHGGGFHGAGFHGFHGGGSHGGGHR